MDAVLDHDMTHEDIMRHHPEMSGAALQRYEDAMGRMSGADRDHFHALLGDLQDMSMQMYTIARDVSYMV